MINGNKVLAIIPARGGSKRVLNKNLREIAGRSLIEWTLADLKSSKYIDHSYVSTDSLEIQKVAKSYNIDCEPLRSAELASDHASSADVVFDIVKNLKTGFDIIILLQPTSPLRTIQDIDSALEFFVSKKALSTTSLTEADCHPSWTTSLSEDMSLSQFVQSIQQKRSQDLEKFYRLNGAIYIVSADAFLNTRSFFSHTNACAYVMPRSHSIDIDTEEDLLLAESLLKIRNKG